MSKGCDMLKNATRTTDKRFTVRNGDDIMEGLNEAEAQEVVWGFFVGKHGISNERPSFYLEQDKTTVTITCL